MKTKVKLEWDKGDWEFDFSRRQDVRRFARWLGELVEKLFGE